jgi:hypothetical protein
MQSITLKSILYLDDNRVPTPPGIIHVKNYDEFVNFLKIYPVPELISFDHDLDPEHYFDASTGEPIPYDSYTEKTGLHCVRYVIENGLNLDRWAIHSFNQVGADNMRAELQKYRPHGELRLKIPFILSHPYGTKAA